MKVISNIQTPDRLPLMQAVKSSVAMILAWFIAQLLVPGELPVLAAATALLVVQPSINQSLSKAIGRSVGVLFGVLLAYGLGILLGKSSWIVLVAIVLCIMLSWAFRLSPGSANQIPISAMLVLSVGATTPNYAFERVIETIIGAVVALLVNVIIVPPVALGPAQNAVSALVDEVANAFDGVAAALVAPQKPAQLDEMKTIAGRLRPLQADANKAIAQAEDSLTLNPRQGKLKGEFLRERDLNAKLPTLVIRAIGMTRTFTTHYDDSLHLEPTVRALSLEFQHAAQDLRLLGEQATDPAHTPLPRHSQQTVPNATPETQTPRPEHWILIGALMEDVRRVREDILSE